MPGITGFSRTILAGIVVGMLVAGLPGPVAPDVLADVFNIKILSDKTPDLHSLEDYCESTTSRWSTNDEKARALAHWMAKLGHQSTPPYGAKPVEPILQFNNFMNAQCGYFTAMYCGVAEGGMGWVGRFYNLGNHNHIAPELEYDGTRHYFDNTYKFYATDCDGERVISIIEMDDVIDCGGGVPEENHLLHRHSPMAVCDDLDGYLPDPVNHLDTSLMRAWLTGTTFGLDAGSMVYIYRQTHPGALDEDWAASHWREAAHGGYHSIYRYSMNLRDNEHFTRHWEQQGTTGDYFYPTVNGGEPDLHTRQRGNGIWAFTPDLTDDRQFDFIENLGFGEPAIHPGDVDLEAVAVWKVNAANLVTGSTIEAELVRAHVDDSVVIEASSNGGHSWSTVWNNESLGGSITVNENISTAVRGQYRLDGQQNDISDLKLVLDYLVRVRMRASGSKADVGVRSITINTITACNPAALPGLGLGRNDITIDIDPEAQFETRSLRPLLRRDHYREDAVDESGLSTWWTAHSESSPTLRPTNSGEDAHVTFELDAPRPIFRIRMGGYIFINRDSSDDLVRYEYRLSEDNGASWTPWATAGTYDWTTRETYHQRIHQSPYVEIELDQYFVRTVQFRFVFRRSAGGLTGASVLRMEVDHAVADPVLQPVEVTYCWTEYFEPLPTDPDEGITRTHVERFDPLAGVDPHGYVINVGGDIPPRMNWIRVNIEGSSPDGHALVGYGDGQDVGAGDEIPPHRYRPGVLISRDRPYTAFPQPASDGYRTPGDDQELTDGRSMGPQVYHNSQLETLSHWGPPSQTPDDPQMLELTVDLGGPTMVGGARVDAYKSFPDAVEVQVSSDGVNFTTMGTDRNLGAKYAHNDWPADWPLYPDHDSPDHPWAVFPNYSLRGNYIHVPFDTPVTARWVRFLIDRGDHDVLLSELHVWESLALEYWPARLAHEGEESSGDVGTGGQHVFKDPGGVGQHTLPGSGKPGRAPAIGISP